MKLTCGVEHLPKRNEEKVMQFYELIGSHVKRDEIMEDLRQLSGFGICRVVL